MTMHVVIHVLVTRANWMIFVVRTGVINWARVQRSRVFVVVLSL